MMPFERGASPTDKPMKFLCVDTATQMESVALVEHDHVVAEVSVARKNGHGGGILDDIHT